MVQKTAAVVSAVDTETFQVVYPAMCAKLPKCGSKAGMNARASPSCCFPATQLQFGYRVFFASDFNFQDAGKLPGLWIGDPKATGGNWLPRGGSIRVMWRTQKGKNPCAVAYLYIPTEVGGSKEAAVKKQNFAAAVPTGRTGVDVWRPGKTETPGFNKLNVGAWNDIAITVGLNTLGQADGYVSLSVNGQSQTIGGMTWRVSDMKIDGIILSSWFGGSEPKRYGSPKDEKAQFQNFWIKKIQ